jgi:hypothetical protein
MLQIYSDFLSLPLAAELSTLDTFVYSRFSFSAYYFGMSLKQFAEASQRIKCSKMKLMTGWPKAPWAAPRARRSPDLVLVSQKI